MNDSYCCMTNQLTESISSKITKSIIPEAKRSLAEKLGKAHQLSRSLNLTMRGKLRTQIGNAAYPLVVTRDFFTNDNAVDVRAPSTLIGEAFQMATASARAAKIRRLLEWYKVNYPDYSFKRDTQILQPLRGKLLLTGGAEISDVSETPILDLLSEVVIELNKYMLVKKGPTTTQWGYYFDESGLTIPKQPVKIKRLQQSERELKPSQYLPGGVEDAFQSARTIALLEKPWIQKGLISSLGIIAHATLNRPALLHAELECFDMSLDTNKNQIISVPLGLLEIMHRYGLMGEPAYHQLACRLRDFILDYIDYETLKEEWPYSVIYEEEFWKEARNVSPLTLARKSGAFRLRMKGIKETRSRIRRMPISGIVTRAGSAAKGNDAKFKQETVDAIHRKEELELSYTKQEADCKRNLRTALLQDINPVLSGDVDAHDVVEKLRKIIEFFKDDTALPGSMRTLDLNLYPLDESRVAKNPFFAWLSELQHPTVAESLREQAQLYPEDTLLLLRQIIYEAGHAFFGRDCTDFLLSPNFASADSTRLKRLVIDLVYSRPRDDEKRLVWDVVSNKALVAGQLTPDKVRQRTQKIEKRIFQRRGPLKIDQRKELTPERKAELKKMGQELGKLLVKASIITGLYTQLILGIFHIIETHQIQKIAEIALKHVDSLVTDILPTDQNYEILIRSDPYIGRSETEIKFETESSPFKYGTILAWPSGKPMPEDGQDIGFFPSMIGDEMYDQYGIGFPPIQKNAERQSLIAEGNTSLNKENLELFIYNIAKPGRVFLPLNKHSIVRVSEPHRFDFNLRPHDKEWDSILVDNARIVNHGIGFEYTNPHIDPSISSGLLEKVRYPSTVIVETVEEQNIPIYGDRVILRSELAQTYEPGGGTLGYGLFTAVSDEEFNSEMNQLRDMFVIQDSSQNPDAVILSIGTNFVDRLQNLRTLVKRDNLTREEFLKLYSDIVVDSSKAMAQHIERNRYYQITEGKEYSFLNELNDLDIGFHCEAAAVAYDEFFTQLGIKVFRVTGFNLKVFHGDELWGKVGHAKNLVWLPDGRLMDVDITPPIVEGKTPDEDARIGDFDAPPKPSPTATETQAPTETPTPKPSPIATETQAILEDSEDDAVIPEKDSDFIDYLHSNEFKQDFEDLANKVKIPLASIAGILLIAKINSSFRKRRRIKKQIEDSFKVTRPLGDDHVDGLVGTETTFNGDTSGVNLEDEDDLKAASKAENPVAEKPLSSLEKQMVVAMALQIACLPDSQPQEKTNQFIEMCIDSLAKWDPQSQLHLVEWLLANSHQIDSRIKPHAALEAMEFYFTHPDDARKDKVEVPYEIQLFVEQYKQVLARNNVRAIQKMMADIENAILLSKQLNESQMRFMLSDLITLLKLERSSSKKLRDRAEQVRNILTKEYSEEAITHANKPLTNLLLDLLTI